MWPFRILPPLSAKPNSTFMHPQLSFRARSTATKFKHILSVGLLSLLGSAGIASADTFADISNEAELLDAIGLTVENQTDDIIDLGGNTIELTSEMAINAESGLDLTISNGTLRRVGDTAFRLVKITGDNGSTVTFNAMTLTGGLYETASGDADQAGGAAIFSDGVDLELINTVLQSNIVMGAGTGGAVFLREASIVADRAVFDMNWVVRGSNAGDASGGAFGSNRALNITFNNSTFSENSASRGGAIAPLNHQQATVITGSTFTNNEATADGGAIWNRGQLSVQTSTFFNNVAGTGGGALYLQPLFMRNTASILRNTFVNNSGGTRANTLLFSSRLNSPEVQGNIFVDNSNANQNCGDIQLALGSPTQFLNGAFNISDDNSCGTATVITDGASLFSSVALSGNGGDTDTIALSATSPAIDVIPLDNSLCTADAVDQRGESIIGNCDVGSFEFQPDLTDGDNDGVFDDDDNCPITPNEGQEDRDENGVGDACDDSDDDGLFDSIDNCPDFVNADQNNLDGDLQGDACDADDDNDGVDDTMDAFPRDANESVDTDGDGIGNNGDSDDDDDRQSDIDEVLCGSDPLDAESTSPDADRDNIPDCADDTPFPDSDEDGIADGDDNCPTTPNDDQANNDGDDQGDVCDNDDDNDGVSDASDAFPLDDTESIDTDGDGIGNNADTDDDGDNVADVNDAFPLDNSESIDTDGDGIGDNADPDADNDGQSDVHEEACESDPLDPTSISSDIDEDGIPDCVDNDFFTDLDGDGVADVDDNCPAIANADQLDTDLDTLGDMCDLDDDNDGVIDANDAFPLDEDESVDTDGDGIGNEADTDDDNDNAVDANDAFPLDPGEQLDTDGDLVGNNADLDDDNDGQLDVDEAACGSEPLDAGSTSPDADGDGIPDCVDDDDTTGSLPVTVYQHVRFSGQSLSAGLGDVTFNEIRNSSVGNDRISSIAIAPGYQVYACQHARFRGRCETFTNDTSDLRSIGFNDVISSFRVSLSSPVTVYEHVNYRGNSLSVGLGDVTIRDLRRSTVGNDRISSIEIAAGYEVTACKHARFRGRCETFTNDTSDLRSIRFNDVISSLEVRLATK